LASCVAFSFGLNVALGVLLELPFDVVEVVLLV